MTKLDEFRAHWPALLAATLGVSLSASGLQLYTSGMFIEPLEQAFGWSRAEISSANGALYWALGAALPFAGRLLDRVGVRRLVMFSMTLLAAGFVILSLMKASLQGYLTIMAAMGLVGSGASVVAFTQVVAQRFDRARGLALGISLMGSGIMGIVAPPVLEHVISQWGWQWGYRVIAALLVLALPVMLLLDSHSTKRFAAPTPSLGLEGRSAWGDRAFWCILLSVVLISFGNVGATVHLVPLLTHLGGSAQTAAWQASLIGVAVLVARPLTGFVIDHLPARFIGMGISLLGGIGCLFLSLEIREIASLSVILIGLTIAAEADLMAYLTSRYLTQYSYGRTFGAIFGASVLASGAAPIALGFFFDIYGNYERAMWLAGGAMALAAPLFLMLGPLKSDSEKEAIITNRGKECSA